jgi:adenosylhomocysteine nucleosidase
LTGPGGSSAAIAIAVALRAEEQAIRGFSAGRGHAAAAPHGRRGALDGVPCILVRTGMGKENAGRAVRALLAAERPALIACLGFAGALRDGLGPGHLVVAREVVDASDGRVHATSPEWLARATALAAPGARTTAGRLVTVERVLRTPAEKERLGRELAAEAADMESSAVIAAAAERGLPVLCARAIIDERALELRLDFARVVAPDGSPRLLELVKAVARRPSLGLELVGLRKRARLAARALGDFAGALAHAARSGSP